ncbi:MAG: hypothetical protein QG567_717 [Campylobacterota bacterium]|nr:hypothetical protein [Campylobacterota bacterium]
MEQSAKGFFADPANKDTKCEWLSNHNKIALEWEQGEVSNYSPSIVEDKEIIARQIFSPLHFDIVNGELLPSAFSDVENKGLSVDRMAYTTDKTLHYNGRTMAAEANQTRTYREYFALYKAKVSTIRSILEGEIRVFAVYDTSLENRKSHADVCKITTSSILPAKSFKLFIRKRLSEAFSEIAKPQ